MKAILISALVALVAAQPHGHQAHAARHAQQKNHARHAALVIDEQQLDKRAGLYTETHWVTETAFVTAWVDQTATYWITPGQKPPGGHYPSDSPDLSPTSQAYVQPPPPAPESEKEAAPSSAPPPPPSSPVPTAAPEPVVEQEEQEPAPSSPVAAHVVESSSVAPPPPPPSSAPAPVSSEVAPEPAPAPVSAAPEKAEAPAPAPAPAEPAPSASVSASVSADVGVEVLDGDGTFFTVGLGSCGQDDTGKGQSEYLVALSAAYMGSAVNNPLCLKTITVTANGRSIDCRVVDKCPECARGSIDMSEKAFIDLFDDLGVGRAPVKWHMKE